MDKYLKKISTNKTRNESSQLCNKNVSEEVRLQEKEKSPSTSDSPPAKIKRIYKFCESWLLDTQLKNWLIKNNNQPMCKVCLILLPLHKAALIRHSESKRHIRLMLRIKNTKKLEDAWLNERSNDEAQTRSAELKLAGLLATNNLPFTLMDTLTPLLHDIFPDSVIAKKVSMGRTKATAVVKHTLAPEFISEINKKLQEACFHS